MGTLISTPIRTLTGILMGIPMGIRTPPPPQPTSSASSTAHHRTRCIRQGSTRDCVMRAMQNGAVIGWVLLTGGCREAS
jgi:hypothetical protein